MPVFDLSRQAAIVGVGTSREFGLVLDRSPLRLQVEAFRAALADAGLDKSQVDGFATAHGAPHGVDYDEFAIQAGCAFSWVSQLWSHGRWASTLVAQAAMAVASGMADCVAVANTVTHGKGYGRHFYGLGESGSREAFRDVGGGHGEAGPYGLDTPGAATAMAAQRYMDKYGATSEDLAVAPLVSRKHARLNPMAIMRDRELTLDEYLASPPLVGPFRVFDYCLRNEGSVCLLVTTAERARELRQRPVMIAGFQGARASRDDFIMFARPGLGIGFTDEYAYSPAPARVYATAGVDRGDVDGLYVYDSFSSNLWMILERFAFCGEGEAFEWVRGGRIELGGELPVNTNGGLQSEAHLSGYAHLVEMVRQLRGEAGPRQIEGAAVLQWMTPWGRLRDPDQGVGQVCQRRRGPAPSSTPTTRSSGMTYASTSCGCSVAMCAGSFDTQSLRCALSACPRSTRGSGCPVVAGWSAPLPSGGRPAIPGGDRGRRSQSRLCTSMRGRA